MILLNPNLTLRQGARLIRFKPLENGPPGSTFAYGGLSMQAAGAAAEVATGESYVELDGDDFLAWQRAALANPLSPADLASWKANFGRAGSEAAQASIAVPEPSTYALAITAICGVAAFRRRRSR